MEHHISRALRSFKRNKLANLSKTILKSLYRQLSLSSPSYTFAAIKFSSLMKMLYT
jgi:hypothetical protein